MNHEHHLFIIWSKARKHEKSIVADIDKKFDILYKVNVKWSKENFSSNLTRFYGVNLPPNSGKEEHIGDDTFLVIVVKDVEPRYDYHETSAGVKHINSRTFLSKIEYRDLTGGGHKIHGTNTQKEFSHDFALLFGCSLDDFSKKYQSDARRVIDYQNDLVGYNGWKSLRQVFEILNLTHEYLVMRNYEPLPGKYYANKHGDIDFLVRDYESVRHTLNAQPVFSESHRVHNKIIVNNDEVLLDLRYVGDNYYDVAWQKRMLKNKSQYNGIYVMDKEDHFYSLLYHALVHKAAVADDYIVTLNRLNKEINVTEDIIDNKWFTSRLSVKKLAGYLAASGYSITKPEPSVYFNNDNVILLDDEIRHADVKRVFELDDVQVLDIIRQIDGVRYYYKAKKGDETVFIKSSHVDYSAEYKLTKMAHDKNPEYFIEPLAFKKGKFNYLMTKWCDGGIELGDYIKNKKNKLTKHQKSILIKDLRAIADILWDLNISHRDLIPRNFIVVNGRLKLIDLYWAVRNDSYNEYDYVKESPHLTIGNLGEDYAKGMYEWDDSYSILKVAKLITGSNVSSYTELKEIQSRVGKRVVTLGAEVFYSALVKQYGRILDLENRQSSIIEEQSNTIAEQKRHINDLNNQVASIKGSKSYRIGRMILLPIRLMRSLLSG